VAVAAEVAVKVVTFMWGKAPTILAAVAAVEVLAELVEVVVAGVLVLYRADPEMAALRDH
jgi:hypothetical protein